MVIKKRLSELLRRRPNVGQLKYFINSISAFSYLHFTVGDVAL